MISISDRVRKAVKKSGLDCSQVAKRSRVSQSTVWRFLQGAEPSASTLERVAIAVGMKIITKER